jgi:hypothetical protein
VPGRSTAAKAAVLEELAYRLGHGQVGAGHQGLALWRKLFLPSVPSYIPRPIPVWTPDPEGGGRWTRRHRSTNLAGLIAQHFNAEIALGGVYVTHTRVLVIDLDNASGKGAQLGQDVPPDPDLGVRRRLAGVMAPKGIWVRSSPSGGLHRWVFFKEEVRIDDLALLAHARLRDCAERLSRDLPQDQLEEIRTRVRGGIRGFELLPRTSGNGQGDTIRAPLGPGSMVLLDDGTPIPDPLAALHHIGRFLDSGGLVRIEEAFPGRVSTQLTLTPAVSPRPSPALAPGHRQAVGLEGRIRALAARCDGRLPEPQRAGPPEVREVASHLRAHSCPPGSRHYSTCILIYDAILDGLAIDQARERLEAWVREVAPRGSRDARERLDEALKDTERLLRFYYRKGRPRPPGGRKPKPPSRLRHRDLVHLRSRLEGQDGRAVGLAGRVLEHVKSNGLQIAGTEDYYCELPVVALGIRSQADYRCRDVLQATGFLRLVRHTIPKLDEWHPKGPRAAKPALWRVSWSFADSGQVLPPVSSIFPGRQKGQVFENQAHDPVFVTARSGGMGGSRQVGGPLESVCPVRAVDAGRCASKGLVGAETPVCSSKNPPPQARQRAQDPKKQAERSPATPRSGRGVRGEGLETGEERRLDALTCLVTARGIVARQGRRSWPSAGRGAWGVGWTERPKDPWKSSSAKQARGPPSGLDHHSYRDGECCLCPASDGRKVGVSTTTLGVCPTNDGTAVGVADLGSLYGGA